MLSMAHSVSMSKFKIHCTSLRSWVRCAPHWLYQPRAPTHVSRVTPLVMRHKLRHSSCMRLNSGSCRSFQLRSWTRKLPPCISQSVSALWPRQLPPRPNKWERWRYRRGLYSIAFTLQPIIISQSSTINCASRIHSSIRSDIATSNTPLTCWHMNGSCSYFRSTCSTCVPFHSLANVERSQIHKSNMHSIYHNYRLKWVFFLSKYRMLLHCADLNMPKMNDILI